jgi:hypothetical protein
VIRQGIHVAALSQGASQQLEAEIGDARPDIDDATQAEQEIVRKAKTEFGFEGGGGERGRGRRLRF